MPIPFGGRHRESRAHDLVRHHVVVHPSSLELAAGAGVEDLRDDGHVFGVLPAGCLLARLAVPDVTEEEEAGQRTAVSLGGVLVVAELVDDEDDGELIHPQLLLQLPPAHRVPLHIVDLGVAQFPDQSVLPGVGRWGIIDADAEEGPRVVLLREDGDRRVGGHVVVELLQDVPKVASPPNHQDLLSLLLDDAADA
jgi:hypothetical protein